MFDVLMTQEQKALREEVRELVKSIPKQLLLDMDADKIAASTNPIIPTGKNPITKERKI